MPAMKIYPNGATVHSGGNRAPSKFERGDVKGWTYATALRQRKFLWSVQALKLTGHGYAMTLTVRDCPPDAATWGRMRTAWMLRAARLGADRIHWVTEWQSRGVPHLHAAVYFPDTVPENVQYAYLALAWLQVCDSFGAEARWKSQDGKPIDGPLGWLKYMAKHASRGAQHYQREGHPEGWLKTGRMWGYRGEWPTVEPIESNLSRPEFYRLRRLMRGWAIADARAAGDRSRAAYLRRAPKLVTDSARSRFQAVSEWVPEDVSLRLLDLLDRESVS
jgi:hypothetical protein